MFVYLILEVLCNIYQVCMTTCCTSRKGASSWLTVTFGSRAISLKSISKAPGSKIIFYVFKLSLLRKSWSLVICLYDLFPRGAMPWLLTKRTKVVSRKILYWPNRKTSLSKGYSKRRTAKILVSRLLELSLLNPGANFCIFNFEIAVYYFCCYII